MNTETSQTIEAPTAAMIHKIQVEKIVMREYAQAIANALGVELVSYDDLVMQGPPFRVRRLCLSAHLADGFANGNSLNGELCGLDNIQDLKMVDRITFADPCQFGAITLYFVHESFSQVNEGEMISTMRIDTRIETTDDGKERVLNTIVQE